MSDLTKVKIWKVLAASNSFWVTTLILYFQERGLTTSQSLSIMSIYYILNVILEFPTGVVGDYFSHKNSIIIGSILGCLMFVLFLFSGSYLYYIFVVAVAALSITLISGSDTALLHSVSSNFKKDLAQITPYAIVLSAINITIGGFIGSLDLRLPLLFSLIYSLPLIFIPLTLKNYKYEKIEGNIFAVALNGIKEIRESNLLKRYILFSSVFAAFFLSIKWFYNPLFQEINIPVSYWGILTSAAFLLVGLGAYIFRRTEKYNLTITSFIMLISILLIGMTKFAIVPMIGIWIAHLAKGYHDTNLGVKMNKVISSKSRASILSFNTLVSRLLASLYMAFAGLLLPSTSFFITMITTVVLISSFIWAPQRFFKKK